MSRFRVIKGGRDANPFQLSAEERAAIEWEIERLIATLDLADGDTDLEAEEDTCAAGDDGCGAFLLDGQTLWGSVEDEPYRNTPRPIYGIDQTRLPLNLTGAVATRLNQLEAR